MGRVFEDRRTTISPAPLAVVEVGAGNGPPEGRAGTGGTGELYGRSGPSAGGR